MKIRVNSEKEAYIETTEAFTFKNLKLLRKGKGPHKKHYIQQPAFLDTETSWNHDNDNPIGWIYQYALEFNNEMVIGQDPITLCEHLKQMKEYYNLTKEDNHIVIYIHNASYDYTYLYQFLRGYFGNPELLALKAHKILIADFDGLEIRCSYLLSNMSLAQWGKKLGNTITKMVGAIDYNEIHYQDEELSITDWEYMVNDVLTMKECVYREMQFYEDTITSIPLTSTGYVRRDSRRAIAGDKAYRKWFQKTKMTVPFFILANRTFAGGLTHGNRRLGGITVYDVDHVDAKSHYPTREMINYMPMGKWLHYYKYETDGPMDPNLFNSLISEYCCIFMVMFTNLRLKPQVTCPCISKHKIHNYWEVEFTNDFGNIGTDNGKVVNATGQIIISCTELDWYWMRQQYETDGITILDMYTSERGLYNDKLRDVINKYFTIKETTPPGVFRDKSKNKLNGIYGQTATNPVREVVEFNYDLMEWTESYSMDEEYLEEQLAKYYRSRNSFNNYTIGIYTTSWARYVLLDVIQNIIGYENFIYTDTDSAFFKSSPEIKKRLDEYNEKVIARNKELGYGVQNLKGEMSYYGTFEYEDHCKAFRFLHSKCYALVTDDDELKVTIAGVTKDNKQPKDHPDYITSAQELGSIDKLEDGFEFRQCGGTKSKYVESPINAALINGHDIIYASACIITTTTKKLGGTVEGMEWYEMD